MKAVFVKELFCCKVNKAVGPFHDAPTCTELDKTGNVISLRHLTASKARRKCQVLKIGIHACVSYTVEPCSKETWRAGCERLTGVMVTGETTGLQLSVPVNLIRVF